MKLPLHFKHAIASCAGLIVCIVLNAQQSISLPGIPHPLSWENKPAAWKTESGKLIVESGPKTDMFRDPNATYNTDNAPKLMFKADEDFVLTAKVSHAFTSKWDGAALVLKADSLHWVKFCFEKDYTGAHRVVSVATNNISDDANHIAVTADFIHLKMAKAGKRVTLYCSGNGKDWLLVRHLQLQTNQTVFAGFLSQSPEGNNCTAVFSDIQYKAQRIEDPYQPGQQP